MIIVFKQNATVAEKSKVKEQLESKGFQIHASDGVNASLFGVTCSFLPPKGTPQTSIFCVLMKA